MSASTAASLAKRPRAETDASTTSPPTLSTSRNPTLSKRQKSTTDPLGDEEDIEMQDDPEADLSSAPGEPPETDAAFTEPTDDDREAEEADAEPTTEPENAVEAVAASARKAKLSAEEKKAKFLERHGHLSPEEALAHVRGTWRSTAYGHFDGPFIVRKNGKIMHKFVCKIHKNVSVSRADYEDSTSNLKRHIAVCDPVDAPEAQAMDDYAHGVTFSWPRIRYLIAMWCARRHRPFSIVEDEEFQEILQMLYPKVRLPSRFTVSRDICMITDVVKDSVISMFESLPGKVHICVDGWTSPNVFSYLGVTSHWHQDGRIQHIILDYIRLNEGHSGKYLAEKLVECLKDYGLDKKLGAVTVDNAENNTTMLKHMTTLIPGFRGTEMRIRCFDHVLNLVVKGIMSQFTRARKGKSGTTPSDDSGADSGTDDFNANPDRLERELREAQRELDNMLADAELDLSHDADEDEDDGDADREAADEALLEALEEEYPELVLTARKVLAGQKALQKILLLSNKVWHSPTVRAALAQLADSAELDSEVLIRAVKTRWNTYAHVLERALELRDVLAQLCDMAQFNKGPGRGRGLRLRNLILTDEEWDIIEQLYRLLQPFVYATTQMSTSTRALVHEVIPYIDILTAHLDDFVDDQTLHPTVRVAAKRGRVVMNKYYSQTDETIIYRIAMLLCPGDKQEYFRRAGWEPEWISVAEEIVRMEWQEHYKPRHRATATANIPPPLKPSAGRRSAQAGAGSREHLRAMFSGIHSKGSTRTSDADPLEAYLKSPALKHVTDPLAYWNAMLMSPEDAPLARFALDFLSIPATSTDAERAFSRGRLTVSRLRHSLSDASVRANTVLGSWARIPGLVPKKDILSKLKGRPGKIGGGAAGSEAVEATLPQPGPSGSGPKASGSGTKTSVAKKASSTLAKKASGPLAKTASNSSTKASASSSKASASSSKASGSAVKSSSASSTGKVDKGKARARADSEVVDLVDSDSD